MDEIKENTTNLMMEIPKEDFADCLKWLYWQKCVRSQGEYFEGN